MQKKDLRREQVKLLRFEKALQETIMGKVALMAGLTSIAAALAPLRRVALSVEAKLSDSKVAEVFEAIINASEASQVDPGVYLHNLALAVWIAHAYVEEQATKAGFRVFQISGGDDKEDLIRSLLGLDKPR